MEYLQASWGFVVLIGGLLVTLIVLTLLDLPAQRRDAERHASSHGSPGGSPPSNVAPK